MVWQPTLIGFFNFRSGVAPKPRGAASAASPAAPVLRNVRRVVRRDAAMSVPPSRMLPLRPESRAQRRPIGGDWELFGCDRPATRLDLLAAVPDGNELARVLDVLERVRVEDEEVGLLARLDRAAVLETQHGCASLAGRVE